MSSILKGITINESLQDDFIDLMKSKGYNVKPRGSIEQQKAERDAMLAQRKKDAENRTAPPTPSAEEITNAKEKLAQLERVFDKNYQYSDDHSVYSKNQDIAQQISSLRQLIARGEQGVAEGAPIIVMPSHKRLEKKHKPSLSRGMDPAKAQGEQDARDGKPYNNPYPFKKELGAPGNWEHNSYKASYDSVKKGVAEGAPELLKKEMPTHRHAEKLLAQNGVSKDDPDYHHHLNNTIKYLRQFGNIDLINKSDEQGVAEGSLNEFALEVSEATSNELVDLESAYRRATEITKQIKYDDTVTQIIVQIQMLAEKSGIPEENLRYEIDQVYEAKSQLESAIYGLDEVFQDAMRQQQYDQEDNDVDESQIFAGGGMGQSYRKFTPKSAGTMNEMPDTSGPVGTQPGGRRVYRPKSAGTNMKRESSILKGLRETGSTGTSAGSAGIGGGAMVGGPTTYEQEFDPFKRKGARRITAMTNEGKK